MKRLTDRNKDGFAYLIKVKEKEQEVESKYPNTLKCILESFARLAAYEDTGLTPEEIQNDIRIHKELWEEKVKELQADRDYWKREQSKIVQS